ncbi:MAG: chromosome segregation in meiosis- protein [Vezdaea aestivalis]|nr:MAG: chromosome segregation in meiosis- protein [Vezdaea aestivalis]
MPSATTRERSGAPIVASDELDDLYNYDVENDDVFGATAQATTSSAQVTSVAGLNSRKRPAIDGDRLGIDEEIKVLKRRAPMVKLDERLLCSQKGLPELQTRVKDRLKFKGKGHEFSDAQRLLVLYQLWLDDLYPKATFKDALRMVEKLGHTRSMQMKRRAWLDKTRVKLVDDYGDSNEKNAVLEGSVDGEVDGPNPVPRSIPIRLQTPPTIEDDTDLYDATPLAKRHRPILPQHDDANGLFLSDGDDDDTDSNKGIPDDDELDALLAEDGMKQVSPPKKIFSSPRGDVVDGLDEMDFVAEMDGSW